MKIISGLLLFLALTVQATTLASKTASRKVYEFTNGRWFDGKSFARRTFYSVSGILTSRKPRKVDETIDLAGGFVVPPFADAHTHNFDGAYNVKQQVQLYLREGVFYAKVQTDVRTGALEVASEVNNPTAVDVSYAHGALTHTRGHGIEIYEGLALGFYGDMKVYNANIDKIAASRLRDNDAYYIIDTARDLDNKWRRILDNKPDFIKIYLLTSEDYERKNSHLSEIPLGSIGLDPKLVPEIVRRAHGAGLRVSAHVDTVTDYRIALSGGVDEMAHLPGYYIGTNDPDSKYELSEADARETARRGVWVIPCPVYDSFPPAIVKRIDAMRIRNLELLKKHRVKLAFGSDAYGRSPVKDVLYLSKQGVFSNLEMLKIWCEDTPRTIFPLRKLGRLRDGYEASFLVLKGNPLENFAEIKNINFRFKQGLPIDLK